MSNECTRECWKEEKQNTRVGVGSPGVGSVLLGMWRKMFVCFFVRYEMKTPNGTVEQQLVHTSRKSL